jgi:hypothetical protein
MPEGMQRLLATHSDLLTVALMPLAYSISPSDDLSSSWEWEQERPLTVQLLNLLDIGEEPQCLVAQEKKCRRSSSAKFTVFFVTRV